MFFWLEKVMFWNNAWDSKNIGPCTFGGIFEKVYSCEKNPENIDNYP